MIKCPNPFCEGGQMPDQYPVDPVKVECWQCKGTGMADENDPAIKESIAFNAETDAALLKELKESGEIDRAHEQALKINKMRDEGLARQKALKGSTFTV